MIKNVMDQRLKETLSLGLTSKICIFLIIYLSANLLPFSKYFHDTNFLYPPDDGINLSSTFKTWDAQHYLFLAEKGYAPGQESNRFFPLFPLLIAAVKPIFLNNTLVAALFLSNLFFFIALYYFYMFTKRTFDPEIAFTASLFLMAFPTAFYTSLVYTESLFLMLTMIFFYCLYEKKLTPALLAAFLLPLARPQGILILLPYMAFMLYKNGAFVLKFSKEYLIGLAFIAGLLVYFMFMHYTTGSAFSGLAAANIVKGRASLMNVTDPFGWFMRNFINVKYYIHYYIYSIIDRLFFLAYVLLIYPVYKKMDKTMFTYMLVLGLVPALSGNLMSYTRLMFEVFPMFIVLALIFRKNHYYVTAPLIALQTFFLIMHCLNFWMS